MESKERWVEVSGRFVKVDGGGCTVYYYPSITA